MAKFFENPSSELDARSRTEVGEDREFRTDSYEMETKDFSGGNEQEPLSSDVVRQDTDELSSSTESLLVFPYPPLEIADYMSHYIPPA